MKTTGIKKTGKPVKVNYRKKAEEALKVKQPDSYLEQDFIKVIHELQVHQIELEMMNEELMRAKEEADLAYRKLKLAIDIGKIGLWEINLQNDSLILDESSERILGVKPGTPGYPTKIADIISEDDLSHFTKSLNSALIQEIQFETVFRSRLAGNIQKFILAKADIQKDHEINSGKISGVFFDIAGLRESSVRVIEMLNQDLLRSNRDLQNFAYVASHDLQEPLRMITSFTQLLEKQYGNQLDDTAREYISFAVDGAKRMYELLNGLLAYSRISTRGHEFVEVDMNRILESVLGNLEMIIKEKRVTIKSDVLPVVLADGNQMIQLLQNLISNSIKFSTRKPEIRISSKNEKKEFLFMVKDNGIGIEDKYFEKVFQIFQRLFPRDKYDGIGIGLAVCKGIVERHNGRIWVESKPGTGSTFFFTIPKHYSPAE